MKTKFLNKLWKRSNIKNFFLLATAYCILLLPTHSFAQVANGTGAGNALSFNGTNNWVDFGNTFNFNNSTNDLPFTFSVWVKRSSLTVGCPILTKYNSSTSPYQQQYYFTITASGKIGVGLFQTPNDFRQTVETTDGITDLNWHNVVCTYTGVGGANAVTGIKVFIDGILSNLIVVLQDINYTHMAATVTPLEISGGTDASGTHHTTTNGTIDEVRIYNRALTETEIRATMCKKLTGTENGLVGYWRFDEGSGSTAYDASPNGNDGTLH